MTVTPTGNPPARLYRPSPPDAFPDENVIAMLDTKTNIVFYRKDVFDTLSPVDQSRVYHMKGGSDDSLVLLIVNPTDFNVFKSME